MKAFDALKRFIMGFVSGLFLTPDDDLKLERVQFWEDQIAPAWKREGDGVALLRTIVSSDARAAGNLAKTLASELQRCGYTADALDVVGHVVSLRLTTATVGKLTERDYAAAALIDLVL